MSSWIAYEFYDKCVNEKKYNLIPPPAFSTVGEDFRGVVEKLAGNQYKKGMVKKFGLCTQKYGVNFLNNVFHLKRILDKERIIWNELINLDHSRPLKGVIVYGIADSHILLNHYPLKRVMNLLLTAEDNEVRDTNYMITSHPVQDELIKFFPRKPKDLKEIHDAVSTGIRKLKHENVPLDQDIEYLHGKEIDEFVIEVPKWSHDLIETSAELHHCGHSYTNKIRSKNCQIINLKKDGKRIYTIEIVKSNGVFEIVQFKGKFNETSMERFSGNYISKKIINLLTIHVEKNEYNKL